MIFPGFFLYLAQRERNILGPPGGRKTPRAVPYAPDPVTERKRPCLRDDGGLQSSSSASGCWHKFRFLKTDSSNEPQSRLKHGLRWLLLLRREAFNWTHWIKVMHKQTSLAWREDAVFGCNFLFWSSTILCAPNPNPDSLFCATGDPTCRLEVCGLR